MERPLDFIPFKISKETVWKVEQLVGLSGSEKASMSSTMVRRAMAAPSGIPGARGTEIFAVDAALDRRSVVSTIAKRAACFASRSEEHTSELQSLMRISYAVFCLKKKIKNKDDNRSTHHIQ